MLPEDALDYELGPGDVISISVSGVRQFEQSVRISNSGRVRVPYVGVMFVAGMTPVQAEQEIARQIRDHELVTEPIVRVQVVEYHARPTFVVGAVTTPGQFIITGEMYVLDLISKSGGLTVAAGDKAFLYRRMPRQRPQTGARLVGVAEMPEKPPSVPAVTPILASATGAEPNPPAAPPADPGQPKPEIIELNLTQLRSGEHPEMNLRLEGGDVLYVPRRKLNNIYIIGDVSNPGAYDMPPRARYTAAQAIILTGGPLKTAKMSKAFLMRYDENGVRQALPVNFKDILEGKQPDIPVRPDDIIFVPNSTAKTIGIGILDMIPMLIQQWLIF
jgi:polysaccharide export outer membrane protein